MTEPGEYLNSEYWYDRFKMRDAELAKLREQREREVDFAEHEIARLREELEELRVLPKVGEWEDMKAELARLREDAAGPCSLHEARYTELLEAVKAVPDCDCCLAWRSMERLRQLIEENDG